MSALPGPFGAQHVAPRAARTVTMLIVAKLVTAAGEGLCRIRNISTGGLMLETRMAVAKDECVRIELRHGRALAGRIVWRDGVRAGLQFDAPVVVEDALAAPAPPVSRIARAPSPRPPRIAAELRIEVQLTAGRAHGVLRDISQGGARLKLPVAVRPGEALSLSLPGLAPKRAWVRWTGAEPGAETGVAFAEPLSFDALGTWLAGHRPG